MSNVHGDFEAGKINDGQAKAEDTENMAAWLMGVKNLQIQPYHLPPLGQLIHTYFLAQVVLMSKTVRDRLFEPLIKIIHNLKTA